MNHIEKLPPKLISLLPRKERVTCTEDQKCMVLNQIKENFNALYDQKIAKYERDASWFKLFNFVKE